MIKRIELINFMSHEHTVIEPSDGLTVLIGPNNCGKSAIVNALQVLCSNPKSTYVLRHGSKQCKIIVETNTGDSICWSRKKSGSPKYEINGKTFDRLNGKIPDELHQVLKLPVVEADKESYDVHFGEQRSPIFLLADKEKAAAQFFASSSDAIRMVEMQTLHKTKVRKNSIELERLKQEQSELAREIEALAPVEKIRKSANDCQTLYQQLQTQRVTEKALTASVQSLETVERRRCVFEGLSAILGNVAAPPAIAATAPLKNVVDQLMQLSSQSNFLTRTSTTLATLETPPKLAATAELKQLSQQLELLDRTDQRLKQTSEKLKPLTTPPALQRTDELRSTIESLELNRHLQQRLESSASTLAALDVPPQILPVDRLQRFIEQLTTANQQSTAINKKSKLLSDIAAPSAPTATAELEMAISDLTKSIENNAQLNQLLQRAEKDLSDAESELEDWIAAHPQCPTCGGKISIGALPCGIGDHHNIAAEAPLTTEARVDE